MSFDPAFSTPGVTLIGPKKAFLVDTFFFGMILFPSIKKIDVLKEVKLTLKPFREFYTCFG